MSKKNNIPTAEERFQKFFDSFPRYGTRLAEDWKKEIIEIADKLAKDKAKIMGTLNLYDVSDKFLEFLETLPQEGKILELTNNFKAFYNLLYEIELEYYENKSLEDSEVNKRLLYEKIVNEFSDFKP